jgi:hypothetical protein
LVNDPFFEPSSPVTLHCTPAFFGSFATVAVSEIVWSTQIDWGVLGESETVIGGSTVICREEDFVGSVVDVAVTVAVAATETEVGVTYVTEVEV